MTNQRKDVSSNQEALLRKLAEIKSLCDEQPPAREILEGLNALEGMLQQIDAEEGGILSAQLSLYPLRQPSLSETINEALKILSDRGLRLNPGSMSTMVLGPVDQIWNGLKAVYTRAAAHGEVVMILTLSNACPKPDPEDG